MITNDIERIGVYTSGGDAPGMNACLRAVVRAAIAQDIDVVGIRRGYEGMIEGDMVEMDRRSVSNIVQTGGTILKSARSPEFREEEGRTRAAEHVRANKIDALVAIGGDGSLRLAQRLSGLGDRVFVAAVRRVDAFLLGAFRVPDPLDAQKAAYVAGDIDEAAFERRVERLLTTDGGRRDP